MAKTRVRNSLNEQHGEEQIILDLALYCHPMFLSGSKEVIFKQDGLSPFHMSVCSLVVHCPLRTSQLDAKNDLQHYLIFFGECFLTCGGSPAGFLHLAFAVQALPSATCDRFSRGCLRERLVADSPSNISFFRGGSE